MKYTTLLLTVVTCGVALTSPARAQATSPARAQATSPLVPFYLDEVPAMRPADFPAMQSPDNDRWRFSLSIPIWIPGIDGDVKVRGRDVNVSQDTSDTVDLFDTHINGAFALHFEAAKGPFGLLVDLMFVDLETAGTNDVIQGKASLTGFIGEFGAFYTIVAPPPGKRGWGTFQVDVLGGVRVSDLELGIETRSSHGTVSRTVYDPFIGARMKFGLTDWLSLKARGDVGGFAIDAWPTSEFSYNIDAGFEFHLAEWFDVGIGYRVLSFDFASSSSKLDATLSGPYVEIKFIF